MAEQLADLSDLIDSFNPQNGKSNKFDNTIDNVGEALRQAPETKQVCQELDSLVKKAQKESGKSLTAAQSAQLVADATRIARLVGC